MQKSHRIPAFTIFEILIALAISGVIVMLAVGLYLTLLKHIQVNSESARLNRQIAGFTAIISRDFESCNYISAHSPYEIECFFYDKTCIYFFETDYVVRLDRLQPDTFHLETTSPKFHFHPDKPDLLLQMEFEIVKDTYSSLPVFLHKKYPVKYLLPGNNDAFLTEKGF